jgi:hypothetical protein
MIKIGKNMFINKMSPEKKLNYYGLNPKPLKLNISTL